MKKVKVYFFFALLTEAVGALAGFLTRNGVKELEMLPKSSLSPPPVVFPVVWSVLYLLMAIGAARVYLSGCEKKKTAMVFFGIQLGMNFLWSIVFFNLQLFGFAFAWIIALWVMILLMTIAFAACDKPAAYLQLPYLLWVLFAAYLNLMVFRLNG